MTRLFSQQALWPSAHATHLFLMPVGSVMSKFLRRYPAVVKLGHDRFVDTARAAHIDVIDAGCSNERCKSQPCCSLLGIALARFSHHEQTPPLLEAKVFERVTGAELFTYLFSPGICWIGFRMNRSGCDVRILQMYS
jgi:hypothetical protein